MRIDNSRRKRSPQAGSGHRRNARVNAPAGAFAGTLQTEVGDQNTAALDELLRSIDEAAKALAQDPTFANLEAYRRLVGEFLRSASRASQQVKEQTSIDHFGNRRVFVVVRTIDRELRDLARKVLEDQTAGLDLVDRLDEIRGMLLDLYN